MAKYDFVFQNTGSSATVNSGDPVWFMGSEFNDDRKAVVLSSPRADGSLPECNQGSYEATNLSVRGYIDISKTGGTYTVNGVANCSKASQALLNDFFLLTQSTNSKILFRAFYKGLGTMSAVEMRNFNNQTGGFNVVIDALRVRVASNSEGNHIWEIDMGLTETR